jgi:hypothetical protein
MSAAHITHSEHRNVNSEHRNVNSEHRNVNSEHRNVNSEHRNVNSEHRNVNILAYKAVHISETTTRLQTALHAALSTRKDP